MKRPNHLNGEETSEDSHKNKVRRISPTGRIGDEEGSGDLDLNATPLGFDLNAPVAEEDLLQAGSGWLSAQEEVVESKPDISEVEVKSPIPLEPEPPAQSRAKNEPIAGPESAQTAAVVKAEETYELQHLNSEEGIDRLSPKEEEDSDQGESRSVKEEETTEHERPLVTVPAVFRRTFEPLNTVTVDDDLDILRSVWSAWQQEDAEALDMTLADTLEELAKNTHSPNRYLLFSCMYISKRLPEAFGLPRTFKVLLSFLESATAQAGLKRQSMLPIVACKLLFRAFAGEPDWPVEFVQLYLLDSTGSRSWIELEGCKEFVSNVLTAFPDEVQDVSLGPEDAVSKSSELQGGAGDLQQGQAVKSEAAVKSRYLQVDVQQKVRAEFCQSLNQLLGAASSKENPRQLLRLLMQGVGFEEVRVVASSMLEGWLNNPVHFRAAKGLLDRVLQHTRGTSENDFNTVANLLALRVPSGQTPAQIKAMHNNIFSDMIANLVRRRPEYATLALKTFVTAEMQSKNPHNIKCITTVLKAMPSDETPAEQELALILQELAASDESRCLLHDFVRRMMKQAGGEFDVHALCHGLIQPWQLMAEQDELLKEAWIDQLVDLTCQLLLHAAAPFVEDDGLFRTITSLSHPTTTLGTSTSGSGLERSTSGAPLKDRLSNLEKFSLDTQNFQMMAMAWCTDVVAVYLPNIDGVRFRKIVRQLLFLEDSEAYFTPPDIATEVEMKYIQLLGACTRAPEEIVARLILMGISNFPVTKPESLDIIEVLVCRAAKLEEHLEGSLVASSSQLPAAIFKLASFDLRGVARQPVSQLVVKGMYWQACLVVLIVAVFNPSTIGRFVWESIPSLRSLMEVLITGCSMPQSNSMNADTKLELDKSEADAEELDKKAEDAVSKFLAEMMRTDPDGVDNIDLASFEIEWKGKLMLLNQSGSLRRPPQAVYHKLDQFNDTYKLGYLLRKCHLPDYFSEVTALQTLQQAWPWVRNIVAREPEVVAHFPIAWQCELLYMLEGSHPTTRKLSVDLMKLRSELRKVVSTPSKDTEIEIIINFLSHKLVAKSCALRYRARRCLTSLFQTNPRHTDVHVSLPSSPREMKRTESTPGGTSRWQGPTLDTINTLPHHPKKAMAGATGSSSAHVSPGISPGLPVAMSNLEKTKAATQEPVLEDDTSWLKLLETLPTASRLISAFLPAIRLAMQQETSISVVVAYLIFLKKHAVPLPSWQSMACSLSVFIMQRKMLTASLLSGAPTLPPAFSLAYPELKSHTGIVDLIVESLSEALETGTVCDTNWEDPVTSRLPMVTFASRQYLGSEQVVRRVTLHKVVVDASLKVLSLLAFKGDEGYEAKHGFAKLLAILFPDTQVSVAWLEGKNGERMPLLGEDQAVLFSRSTVPKLVRAGLAELPLGTKLSLCEKLGLSPVASILLLQDLDVVTQVSLGAVLGLRGFSGHRAKKLQNCVHALMQPGNPCGSRFLGLLEVYAASNVQGMAKLSYLPSSKDTEIEVEDVARMDIDSMKRLSGQMLADRVFQYLQPRGMDVMLEHPNISAYFILRHISQQALLCSNDGDLMPIIITRCVDALEHITQRIGEGGLTDTMCLFLTLPILYILVQVKNERLIQGLCTLVCVIRRGVESRINNSSQGLDSQVLLNSVLLFLNKSVGKIGDPRGAKRTGSSLACSFRDTKLTKLIKVPLHRFEGLVRLIVHEKLKLLWENRKDEGQSRPEKLGSKGRVVLEMVDLLYTWRHDIGNVQQFSGLEEQVEWMGRYALISEFLMYLDPEFTSIPHFASIFGDSKVLREKSSFSLPNLALNFIIHSASWHTISWILAALLAECLKQKGETRMAEGLYTGHPHTDCVQMENGVGDLFKKQLDKDQILVEASSVLDFALLCMRHPRTVLACRLNDNLDPFEHVTEGVFSSFGPESVRALSTLAVADTMAVGSNIDMDLEDRDQSLNLHSKISNFGYPLVSSSRALKVLLVAACQGPHILSTIVKQLSKFDGKAESCKHSTWCALCRDALGQGNDADVLVVLNLNPERKKNVPKLVAGVAHELLMGLYQAFPVSMRTILHVPKEEKGPALHMLVQNQKFMRGNTRQTCALHSVLHRALRSICNGSEKEAKAAYGFCHDMARQHPTLVVSHLPTLTFQFKDMLPMVKQQDVQVRSTVARVYSYGVGLLDALRPHLLSNFENTDTVSSNKASLKIILGFYFKFLQHLEVQDKIYFSKVVARLADFLCHCVNAGGYYRDYVSSYRIPVIQPAAQTFGKIKKLGFLLGMLAKPADKEVPSSPDVLKSVSDEGKTLVVGGSLGPPALALEKVLKVESQLLQCLRWQGVKRLEDSRLELFDRRMTIPSIRYEMKKGRDSEELNLVAILEDLEKSSNRMPAVLSVLEDSLLELTHISDPNVRDRAYVLLERLLLHCPSESTATKILQRLLQQLSSVDTSLAKTAARQASRFFYYCSELQEKMLMEMLHIGRFATEDDLQQLLQGLLTVCGGSSI